MFNPLKNLFTRQTSPRDGSVDRWVIHAPMTGTMVSLAQVPDTTFAQKMVGDGCAISPTSNLVVAPIAGRLIRWVKTHHAFVMRFHDAPLDLLVHVGIESVLLGGRGFKPLVEEGAELALNQPVLELDLRAIEQEAKSLITPVVILNPELLSKCHPCLSSGSVVDAGVTPILNLTLKSEH